MEIELRRTSIVSSRNTTNIIGTGQPSSNPPILSCNQIVAPFLMLRNYLTLRIVVPAVSVQTRATYQVLWYLCKLYLIFNPQPMNVLAWLVNTALWFFFF